MTRPARARPTLRTPAPQSLPPRRRAERPAAANTRRLAARLPGARKASQPTALAPQLAQPAGVPPEGNQWAHELKYDGYRLLAHVERGRARLLTRRAQNWTGRFPAVAAAIERLPIRSAILDGELVVLGEDGRPDFQALQNSIRRSHPVRYAYFVFDLPYCEGYDLRRSTLADRKAILASLFAEQDSQIARFSEHLVGQGRKVWEHACRLGLEGIVSKRLDGPYTSRRGPQWLKIKCTRRQEFVIAGFTRPRGRRTSFGALLLGYYDVGNRLVYCGRVGTGFSDESLRYVRSRLRALASDRSWFVQPPADRPAGTIQWTAPELVAEVAFAGWTRDGLLRQASFLGLREDKPAHEVRREQPDIEPPVPDIPSKVVQSDVCAPIRRAPRDRKTIRQTKRARPVRPLRDANMTTIAGVRLTHPDRILYPDQGLTKLDLANYYVSVQHRILPHVAGRPLMIVRCPTGQQGSCFHQKHITESLPAPLRGVAVEEKSQVRKYIVLDDLAGLIGLVQMGVLEIHPWGSREDRLERPDRLVLDLDPGEGVPWPLVVQAARELRDALAELGLASFVRTTGGKGLHVVMPIARRATWEQVRTFSEKLAQQFARRHPDRYVATMSKSKRHGKIFVDYLRNTRGATAIASYSTRARPGAPVATPLAWDELSEATRPQDLNARSIPARLAELAVDPWEGLDKVGQILTKKHLAAVGA